jgi:hypothetical protein
MSAPNWAHAKLTSDCLFCNQKEERAISLFNITDNSPWSGCVKGHAALVSIPDTPYCTTCTHETDTVEHRLLDCLAESYVSARVRMLKAVWRIWKSSQDGSPDCPPTSGRMAIQHFLIPPASWPGTKLRALQAALVRFVYDAKWDRTIFKGPGPDMYSNAKLWALEYRDRHSGLMALLSYVWKEPPPQVLGAEPT